MLTNENGILPYMYVIDPLYFSDMDFINRDNDTEYKYEHGGQVDHP